MMLRCIILSLLLIGFFVNSAWADEPLSTIINKGHSPYTFSARFSPDGNYIVSGGADRTVKIWHVRTGKLIRTLTGHEGDVQTVRFSSDGKYVASGEMKYGDAMIRVWDIESGKSLWTFHRERSHVTILAFSPDGNNLASAGWGSSIGRR